MFACVLGRYVASSLISTQTFRMALTVSVGSCAEIRRGSQWRNQFWQSLEEGAESDARSVHVLIVLIVFGSYRSELLTCY